MRFLYLVVLLLTSVFTFTVKAESDLGYSLQTPAPNSDGVFRVLIIHDMEGLSGQDDWHSALSLYEKEYANAQELLAGDVNAVADGLFAGGADEVHVADGHGGTNPEPDLRADLLDPRVVQVFRDQAFDTYTDLAEAGVYDAVAVVGMHAKTLSNGFLSHTIGLGTNFIFNGMSVTETEIIAFSFARVGVPVIFASGDDVHKEDLQRMPWVQYAQVKESENAYTIKKMLPLKKARALLKKKAKRAVADINNAKVMALNEPVAAAMQVVPPSNLSGLKGMPGLHYSDNRVDFIAKDFISAYLGTKNLAIYGYKAGNNKATIEHAAGVLGAKELSIQVWDLFGGRTLKYEAGEWQPTEKTAPKKDRYHGY